MVYSDIMKSIFTRHAKKRMQQRGVSSSRATSGLGSRSRYQGKGVYKTETERNGIKFVVVHKREHGKRIIISTWRKQKRKK